MAIMVKTRKFNQFLKFARMDPAEFAIKTGFNLTRLYDLIENRREVSISFITINKFCQAFHDAGVDVQPGEFLEYVPDPPSKN